MFVKLSLVIIPLFAVSLCVLWKYQDADLTLHFYEKFGVNPCSILKGKVVWITGASSGIGEHLAYELCKCGSKLVLSARRRNQLERVKDKCAAIAQDHHGNTYHKENSLMTLPLDLREFSTHQELTKTVIDHFQRIDVLVNNAGRSQYSWVHETALDIERELMDLNFVGTVSLTKAVLPYMMKDNSGQIVVVSSVNGKFGFPYQATYAASKFALHGYFNSLRMELSETNINVQIVCPGPVKSDIAGNGFTAIKNKSYKDLPSFKDGERAPTDRCAYLMAVGMAHNVTETWISIHPALLLTYMSEYAPTTFEWYSRKYFISLTKSMFIKS